MEEEEAMATQSILYETLSPLSLVAATSTDHQASPSEDLELYSVFRNEISLTTLHCASSETAAPEFFSLDVSADNSEQVSTSYPPSPATPRAVAETPASEAEPKLESGWFRGNNRFKSPMLQLHKEIVDFCEFLSPTPEEQAARDTAVERVFAVVRHIWPHSDVEVFGSFKTGLFLPTSDIDAVILGSGIPTPQLGLHALSRALSQRGIAKKIQVIGKARVPIIKFVEKKSGFAFDISFDVQNGPKAADYIENVVAKWPPLRPLCLILKVFLQQRELNEVYSGGLGSYALLTMLMAMLQNFYGSQSSREQNLGILLVNFFDLYGRKLNTSDVGVSCNGGGTFFLKSSKGFITKGRPFLISIEDPQAQENDIGKSSFNYFQVRSAFAMAFTTLTNPKIILSLGPNRSILGTIIRPDSVLLERKGGTGGDVTFNMLLPGAGEPLQPTYGDQQEILGNWQFDEEPLPRGNDAAEEANAHSSGKKRKASSKEKSGKKKVKQNGEVKRRKHEKDGSSKEKKVLKRHWRHNRDDGNQRSRYSGNGSPWTR